MNKLLIEFIETPGYVEVSLLILGLIFATIAVLWSGLMMAGIMVGAGAFGSAMAFNLTRKIKYKV